jgi:hypothetical protein
MSNFGDFDDDDALDTEPADPVQVAIKLQDLRRRANLSRRVDRHDWDDLDDEDKAQLISIITALLTWMRRQGSDR